MNKLQQIFLDNYEEIILTLRLRDCERENIDKMINCGNPAFGGAMYACTKCGKMKFVTFRCHSRFCPTCGVKYAIDRTAAMSFKVIGVAHRHCVFTIAEELRDLFLKDRDLLNLLFDAVNSVVSRMFHKLNKKENFTPGFICVLHTFGRDLKWNPHIHCLISEGGLSDKGFWRNVHYFNYKLLRDSFQTALLSLLHKRLGDSFKKTKAAVYRNHKNGFYVYAKPKKCEPSKVLKYVGRYLGRPVIATKRILNYDGKNVTFYYNRHEDEKYIEETVPVMDFVRRLIRHIPEKHFKMIRYYGIYARHLDSDKKLNKAIHPCKRRFILAYNKWESLILSSFGYDPLICDCGQKMEFLELYYNHQRVDLQELYERTMRNARMKRGPDRSSVSHISPSCGKIVKKDGGCRYGSNPVESTQKKIYR